METEFLVYLLFRMKRRVTYREKAGLNGIFGLHVRVRGIIGVDRFIRSQIRQRDFCYETELEVEVVFSNVIERNDTKAVSVP
jgi:hypothetical protein